MIGIYGTTSVAVRHRAIVSGARLDRDAPFWSAGTLRHWDDVKVAHSTGGTKHREGSLPEDQRPLLFAL